MTTQTFGTVMVTAQLADLNAARERAGLSVGKVARLVGSQPSRATVHNVFSHPGYGIARDKAERIADAIGVPVKEVFAHKDGSPLA